MAMPPLMAGSQVPASRSWGRLAGLVLPGWGPVVLILLGVSLLMSRGRAGVLELDGCGSYAELPEGLGADWEEFTLEFRVRWDHFGYYDSPLQFGDATNAVAFNHQAWGFRTPVVFVQPGNRAPVKATGGEVLEQGRWIHLAATVGTRGLRLFANGICIATNASTVPKGLLSRSPNRWLGRSAWPDNGYFRGALDDVCVWNRVLSDEELLLRRAAPITGTESGLVAAWMFETPPESGTQRVCWSVGGNRWPATLRAAARVAPGHPLETEPFLKPVRILGTAHSDAGPTDVGRVRLWNGDALLHEALVEAGGVFRLDLVTPPASLDLEVGNGGLGAWQRVQVVPGALETISVKLQPCRSAFGRVTTMNGVPQSGAEVTAYRVGSRGAVPGRDRAVGMVRTDSSGRFEFLNLPEGSYRIVCSVAPNSLLLGPSSDPEVLCEVRSGRPVEIADFRIPRLHGGHHWRRLGKEDGLPEQGVLAIVGDPAGNVWFGTSGGLSRYDGISVRTWRRGDGLPSETVTALAMDSNQVLWVGTASGIVCLREDRLLRAPGPAAPQWPISALAVGPDRSVWAGTAEGLFRWDGRQWTRFGPEEGLPSRLVRCLKFLQDGSLLIRTDGGVLRWRAERFELLPDGDPIPGLPAAAPDWARSSDMPFGFTPSEWQKTPSGETWAMDTGGLFRHDGRRWFKTGLGGDEAAFGYVESMALDSRGILWVGTRGKGAWRQVDDRVRQWDEADGIPGRMVYATERTADGSLWIGTDGGVARWRDGLLQTWTALDGLPARQIRSMKGDRDGRLWLGTDSGVLRFDGHQFSPVPGGPKATIPGISEGTDGTIWLSTSGEGIIRWTSREGFRRFGEDRGIWEGHLSSIHSARNGTLWYTQDGYVARVNSDQILLTYLTPSGESSDEASAYQVVTTNDVGAIDSRFRISASALAEGPDGTVWVGTRSAGLLRFRAGRWTHFPRGSGLPSAQILSAHVAGDGRFWCGTTAGACVFDGELWSVLDTRDGLSGNEVLSIRSDADGTLWLGTDQGLTRYVPVRRPISVTIASIENGELWAGDADGTSVTTGERVSITAGTERAHRVRWRVTGPDGVPGAWSLPDPSPTRVWRPERAGEHVIEAMAVDRDLNRSLPARVAIRVRQPWHRNPWVMAPVWTLGVGMVGAMTWMGVRGRRIRLESDRLRREAAERAEQERLRGQFARELINTQEAERRRLASELHDSLGQELLLIRNTALLAAQAAPEGAENGPLADIASRASRTIQEVRAIAYALRPQELDRLGLVRALRTLCEEMTEAAGLELVFEADPIQGPLAADAEISLYRAVQEALSNVVRHARARRVTFGILEMGGKVVARLQDDGIGFDPNVRPAGRAGLGLIGMNERMRLVGGTCSLSSGAGSGTVVEFRIPLRRSEPSSSPPETPLS